MFSHITNTKRSDAVDYEIYQIRLADKTPVLTVRPATELNSSYYSELLRTKSGKQIMRSNGHLDPKKLEQHRLTEVKLFAKHVVVGWRNVIDEAGNEPPFTKDNVAEFLEATVKLDPSIFDELRGFCASSANFIDGDIDPVEDVAKN